MFTSGAYFILALTFSRLFDFVRKAFPTKIGLSASSAAVVNLTVTALLPRPVVEFTRIDVTVLAGFRTKDRRQ